MNPAEKGCLGNSGASRRAEYAAANKRITELEDLLFAMGAMEEAPCFCCGYDGPGYFQPGKHKCAARHHMLKRDSNDPRGRALQEIPTLDLGKRKVPEYTRLLNAFYEWQQ